MDFIGDEFTPMPSKWMLDYGYDFDWSTRPDIGAHFYTRLPFLTADSPFLELSEAQDVYYGNLPGWVRATSEPWNWGGDGDEDPAYPSLKITSLTSSGTLFLQLQQGNSATEAAVEDGFGWRFDRIPYDLSPPPEQPPYASCAQEKIAGAVLYLPGANDHGVVNPMICVIKNGFGDFVVNDGSTYGMYTDPEYVSGSPYLLSWNGLELKAGASFLQPGPPRWEPARVEHLWLRPQRINYIANPQFFNTDEGGPT